MSRTIDKVMQAMADSAINLSPRQDPDSYEARYGTNLAGAQLLAMLRHHQNPISASSAASSAASSPFPQFSYSTLTEALGLNDDLSQRIEYSRDFLLDCAKDMSSHLLPNALAQKFLEYPEIQRDHQPLRQGPAKPSVRNGAHNYWEQRQNNYKHQVHQEQPYFQVYPPFGLNPIRRTKRYVYDERIEKFVAADY